MHTVALVVAAGRGERFGGALPKQYAGLAGKPVLRHAIEAFVRHPRIDAVRVVIGPRRRGALSAGDGWARPAAAGRRRRARGRKRCGWAWRASRELAPAAC